MENRASIYEENVAQIAARISRGCKATQSLGVEFEHILVKKGTQDAVSYDEPNGVRAVLERLAAHYPTEMREDGDLLGLAGNNATITLEPAACLEYSAGPFESVAQAEASYQDFRTKIDPVLEEFGLTIALLGYHPTKRAEELKLIPKQRYFGMDKYLSGIGPYGRCMMRGSASLQVSIDFSSEEDAVRKLRIADALAPLFALLCDNAPIFEGQRHYEHMARTLIWQNYDPARAQVIPGTFSPGFGFARYAEFVMNTAAIIVPTEEGWRYVGAQTFAEVYADRVMTPAEADHALSIIFPDARLKNFLEIRPADALPLPYAMGYVALIKGLFYSEENLNALDSAIEGVTEEEISQAKDALRKEGYNAVLRGKTPDAWLASLFTLAEAALPAEDAAYLEPLRSLSAARETLAMRYEG